MILERWVVEKKRIYRYVYFHEFDITIYILKKCSFSDHMSYVNFIWYKSDNVWESKGILYFGTIQNYLFS